MGHGRVVFMLVVAATCFRLGRVEPSAWKAGQMPSGGRFPEPCIAATDPDYALTPQTAVRIGGGAMYVAARERRYLEGLRGPDGQPLRAQRRGFTNARGRTNGRPVDMWELTWDGAEKALTLYLDAYDYGEPRVPAGLTCAGFRLGFPPIDGFMGADIQTAVAVEQGSVREFAPISLDPDGTSAHGVMFDRFRQIARASKVAAAAGTPLDPRDLPPALNRGGLIIVAFPKACGARLSAPRAIDVTSGRSGPVKPVGPPVKGKDIGTLVAGFDAPEGALAVAMPFLNLRPADQVRIRYDASACGEDDRETMFSAAVTPNKGLAMPEPTLPEGTGPPDEAVWFQAVVDLDGRLVQATRIGGPEDPLLIERALGTLADWRAEPARVNGSPVVSDTLLVFRFRGSGFRLGFGRLPQR
jgi:hypothetical protein